jgi:hypothetical protein
VGRQWLQAYLRKSRAQEKILLPPGFDANGIGWRRGKIGEHRLVLIVVHLVVDESVQVLLDDG